MARWFNQHRDVCICGLLCLITAIASLGFVMWQNAGAFVVCYDFDFQQIPFTIALHKQIERGGLFGWCWNLDLGASAIQGFGFYELGSPFFWASMLFPADAFPYVVGWMYVVKYVVAGVAAHLFARRFVGRGVCATVVGLLYAFSGFQTTNLMFYHFHDVVALFPFLLIGLERLMGDKRDFACFVLAVFANALVNYFFFVQSVVFLLVYFAVRFGPALWREGPRALALAALRCLACGLVGCGMAAMLLVPSLVYMVQYPGVGKSTVDVLRPLPDQREFLHFIGGMLLPADAMNGHNAVYRTRYISAACWLPLVGPSFALAYVRRHRDWLTVLLVLLTVVAFSPVLSAVFVLFKGMYCRWWHALALLAALASAKVLDEVLDVVSARGRKAADARIEGGAADAACVDRMAGQTQDLLKSVVWGTAVTVVLVLLYVAWLELQTQVLGTKLVFHQKRFLLYAFAGGMTPMIACALVALGGLRATRVGRLVSVRAISRRFVAAIAIACCASTAVTLWFYRQKGTEDTLENLRVGMRLEAIDPQYRYAISDNRLTLTGDAAGTSAFSSTISVATLRLERVFDLPLNAVIHLNKESVPGLSELLGGKYNIAAGWVPDGWQRVEGKGVAVGNKAFDVVERDACPMATVCSRYIPQDELLELDVATRAVALLQAPAVLREDERAVDGYATAVHADDLNLSASIPELVAQANAAEAGSVGEFKRGDWGFSFTSNMHADALVRLSVPNDAGWKVAVDGGQVEPIDSVGMMLLPLAAGTHKVEARYQTLGARIGVVVSAVSFGVFALAAVLARRSLVQKKVVAERETLA